MRTCQHNIVFIKWLYIRRSNQINGGLWIYMIYYYYYYYGDCILKIFWMGLQNQHVKLQLDVEDAVVSFDPNIIGTYWNVQLWERKRTRTKGGHKQSVAPVTHSDAEAKSINNKNRSNHKVPGGGGGINEAVFREAFPKYFFNGYFQEWLTNITIS